MSPKKGKLIEDLGDGLILRRSTPADAEALGEFNARIHADPGQDSVEHIRHWVVDILTNEHPNFKHEDFTIVEEKETGKIVSSMNFYDQTWTYDGIEFGAGRPELVGTLPAYRRRGLVSKQFEVFHGWSKERGHLLQAITGIPWYYRQFGYEMTVNLGGNRQGYLPSIPGLKDDEEEPYLMRPVKKKDLAFITRLYKQSTQRQLLACKRDKAFWEYDIFVRDPRSTPAVATYIIETPEGERVGYLSHAPIIFGTTFFMMDFEIIEGLSWLKVTPSVLRFMEKRGKEIAERDSTEEKEQKFSSIALDFGETHPVYDVVGTRFPRFNKPYSWYIRVADVPAFLKRIKPVLEDRLESSILVGHSGELNLNFYTDGVKMRFKDGKIRKIEAWEKPDMHEASASFRDLSFLHLLFGQHSFEELDQISADTGFSFNRCPEAPLLLNILFPKKPSMVNPIA